MQFCTFTTFNLLFIRRTAIFSKAPPRLLVINNGHNICRQYSGKLSAGRTLLNTIQKQQPAAAGYMCMVSELNGNLDINRKQSEKTMNMHK